MDARVRRAALATAMKVTITSSLLGCGGATTDPSSGAHAGRSPAMPSGVSSSPTTAEGGSTSAESSPSTGGSSSGSRGGGGSVNGAASQGGAAGGLAQGGAGGDEVTEASAGAPGAAGTPTGEAGAASTSACAPEVLTCLESLAELGLSVGDPLPDVANAKECCQTVAAVVGDVPANACQTELKPRYTPLRTACCSALSWSATGCVAWGPPVPPELTPEALDAWSNAA